VYIFCWHHSFQFSCPWVLDSGVTYHKFVLVISWKARFELIWRATSLSHVSVIWVVFPNCNFLSKCLSQISSQVFEAITLYSALAIDLKKDINVFHPLLTTTLFFANVTFIESSFYFKSWSSPPVSPSNQVYIPIVFDTLVVSSVPKYSSHPPPLQVYSHHQTSHCPSDDSLLVPVLIVHFD